MVMTEQLGQQDLQYEQQEWDSGLAGGHTRTLQLVGITVGGSDSGNPTIVLLQTQTEEFTGETETITAQNIDN